METANLIKPFEASKLSETKSPVIVAIMVVMIMILQISYHSQNYSPHKMYIFLLKFKIRAFSLEFLHMRDFSTDAVSGIYDKSGVPGPSQEILSKLLLES